MKEVTDPNLISQLEVKEVTDPALLAQLNAPAKWKTIGKKEDSPEKSVGGFISNIGSDIVDTAKGVYNMVRHPVDTATSMRDLVAGAGGELRKATGMAPNPYLSQEGRERAAATFAPVKESIEKSIKDPASIPGRVVDYAYEKPVQSALMLSQGLGMAGKAAEVSNLPKIASGLRTAETVTNPLSSVTKIPTKAVEKVAKETVGTMTGAGPGWVEQAVKGSPDFEKALRGQISGEEVVQNAKDALQVVRDDRSTAYRARLAEISKNKTPIDIGKLKNEITESLKKYVRYKEPQSIASASEAKIAKAVKNPSAGGGFVVQFSDGEYLMSHGSPQWFKSESEAQRVAASRNRSAPQKVQVTIPGSFDWSRTTVGSLRETKNGWQGSGAAKELKTEYDRIMSWGSKPEDLTPLGLDMLKRHLDQFYSDKSDIRAFTANARKKVADLISTNVPEYGEMTKGYAEASKLIKDIESNLMLRKEGMTGRITADNTLRRLSSALRENFEMRKDLLNTLGTESGVDVAAQVAGYIGNQWIPRGGLAKLGIGGSLYYFHLFNPKLWPVLASSSPRVMGEFLNAFGKAAHTEAAQGVSSVARKVMTPDVARIGAIAGGQLGQQGDDTE